MIKPFRLQDTFLVAKLQHQGLALNLEERLIHNCVPLRSALLAGLSPITPQISTYILKFADKNNPIQGVIQTRTRPRRPEQEIVFVAPVSETTEGDHQVGQETAPSRMLAEEQQTDAIWQQLLIHLVQRTGEAGYYRLYARLDSGDEALHRFKRVGFTPYAEEEFFRLFPTGPLLQAHHPLKLRKQTAADSWSLQRLYTSITPQSVQIAEGSAQGQWQVKNYLLDDQGRQRGFVWESQHEISAVLHLRTGQKGHLIKLLVHPEAVAQTHNLMLAGLDLLKNQQQRPVYVSLRTYQVGLRNTLIDMGFTAFAKQMVMVKHITVRAKDFLTRLVSAFESSAEVHPQPASPTMIVPRQKSEVNGDMLGG